VEGYLAHKWGLVPYYDSSIPLTIPGCQLWLDGADPAGTGVRPANGTNLTTWKDKSIYNFPITSAGSSYNTTAVNGLPGINISTNPFGYNPGSAQNNWQEVFAVGLWTGGSTFNTFNGFITSCGENDGGAGGGIIFIGDGTTNWYDINAYQTPFLNGIQTNTALPTIQSPFYIRTHSTSAVYVTGLQLGVDRGNVRNWVGFISEVIMYNTALTTSQRQTIEQYLSRKWGIGSSSIPSTHPFYSIRPHLRAFQPIDVPGCQLWLDAADALNFTGPIWNDKSGTNNHAVNGTPGTTSMPTVTTWSNGLRAARFVKESKNSIKTTNSIPVFVTYFIVARIQDVTGATGIGFIMINNVDGQRQVRMNSTSFPVSVFFFTQTGGTNMVFGSFSQGQGFLFSGTVTSGSAIAYGNGVQSGTSGVNNSSPSRHYFGSGDGDNDYLSVDFAEILIYDSVLTSSQRQQVEGYLAHKWGLSLYLPVISPLSISGCALWLDAADSSTVTGTTTVTQWRDKSGNARHLGVGSGTTSYSSSAIVLNSSYMFVNSPVNLTNVTVFIVTKSTGGNNQTVFTARPNSGWSWNSFDGFGFYIDAAVPKIRFYGDSNNLSQFNVNTSTTRLFSFQSSGTSINSWLDGTSQSGATLSSTRTSTAQGFAIGAEWNRDQNAYINVAATCSIYEIITYNNALTTTQRQQVEGYLARKWGISISATLPSPHSFKSFPPASLPFSPRNISGLQLWLDGADQNAMTLSGSNVTAWNDKSGNGYVMTNNGGTTTIATASLNSLTTVYTPSGTNTRITNFVGRTKCTMFLVGKAASSRYLLSLNGGFLYTANDSLLYFSPPTGDYLDLVDSVSGSIVSNNTWFILCIGYDNATNSTANPYTINGTTRSTTITPRGTPGILTDQNITSTLYINSTNGTNSYDSVYTAEILYYNDTLTTTQRQQVEGYLAQKWGLTGSLPSSHPFKKLPA
jgi:hypothetical protein